VSALKDSAFSAGGRAGGYPGASIDEILSGYTFLEREDILDAIDYAAHQAGQTVLTITQSPISHRP
jgi:hypothetical protein